MNELSLFTGAGGGCLASRLLGHRIVGYVEIDAFCQSVIEARCRQAVLDPAPIFGNIKKFVLSGAAREYRGVADVVSGGFPCQPFSVAGKRLGRRDKRDLWAWMWQVVREVRPRYVFAENVPGLLSWDGRSRFGEVVGSLAALGYGVRWTVLGADDVGAPHRRKRLWILADARRSGVYGDIRAAHGAEGEDEGWPAPDLHGVALVRGRDAEGVDPDSSRDVADAFGGRCDGRPYEPIREPQGRTSTQPGGEVGWWSLDPADLPDAEDADGRRADGTDDAGWRDSETRRQNQLDAGEEHGSVEPLVGGVLDGLADQLDFARAAFGGCIPRVAVGVKDRVARLRALGNGQVPMTAAMAWMLLKGANNEV